MKDSIINLVVLRIAQGYEEQLPHYEEMLRSAQEQEACLQEEEVSTDRIMELIQRRQELIDCLEARNQEITRLKEEVRVSLGWEQFTLTRLREQLKGAGTETLASVLEKLTTILRQIKELDKVNEETLQVHLQKTGEKLKQLKNTKKMNNAYQANQQSRDGVFIDTIK